MQQHHHPTGHERMGSPTLQTLQDPICWCLGSAFEANGFPNSCDTVPTGDSAVYIGPPTDTAFQSINQQHRYARAARVRVVRVPAGASSSCSGMGWYDCCTSTPALPPSASTTTVYASVHRISAPAVTATTVAAVYIIANPGVTSSSLRHWQGESESVRVELRCGSRRDLKARPGLGTPSEAETDERLAWRAT